MQLLNNCPLISIIVPVYKVEKYLKKCVESILAQTYKNFELILIDDGSPDNCPDLCDEFAQHDSRITVIHKKNGGVSSARNLGLENANGEWVVFIDGDDTITKDHLKLIAENPEHDLVVFGMATDRYTPEGKLHYTSSALIPDKYVQQFCKLKEDYSLINKSLNMESSCCKGFRRDIIEKNSIRFNNKMICFEDFDFVLRYMKCCNGTFCSLPYIAYHYIQELSYNPISRRDNRDLSHSIFILIGHLTEWIAPEDSPGRKGPSFYGSIFFDRFDRILGTGRIVDTGRIPFHTRQILLIETNTFQHEFFHFLLPLIYDFMKMSQVQQCFLNLMIIFPFRTDSCYDNNIITALKSLFL